MFLGPHLYRSVIILLVRVQFESCVHLYRSTISLSYQFVFRDRTYIDRSLSCQLVFGAAPISIDHLLDMSVCVSKALLYRSAISLSDQFVFRDNTYIDRSLSCQLEFGAAPISIGHLLVISVCVSGPHLYRSVIVLSVRVQGRTYINRPSLCHITMCFGTAPISIGRCLVS